MNALRHQPRTLIHHKKTEQHQSLAAVHRELAGRGHGHVCINAECRLYYEDTCQTPEVNHPCQVCLGHRRPWVSDRENGRTSADPHECCVDNTRLMTNPADLLRYDCAGPGPWFQCRTCKRTHGHPCTDDELLERPLAALPPLEGF